MSASTASTAAPEIVVRRPRLALDAPLAPHWAGSPFATHVFDALSSVFPDGEAFFVRSVRHYADRIDDPGLRDRIRGFAAQEGRHSAEHDRHLALITERYPGIERRNATARRRAATSRLRSRHRYPRRR